MKESYVELICALLEFQKERASVSANLDDLSPLISLCVWNIMHFC